LAATWLILGAELPSLVQQEGPTAFTLIADWLYVAELSDAIQ